MKKEIKRVRKLIEDSNFRRYEVEEKRKASNMQMVHGEKIWKEAQKDLVKQLNSYFEEHYSWHNMGTDWRNTWRKQMEQKLKDITNN